MGALRRVGATLIGVSLSEPVPRRLSQRELRNESGRVLRAVSEGQSFVLTNGGVPVAGVVPLDAPALPNSRPGGAGMC